MVLSHSLLSSISCCYFSVKPIFHPTIILYLLIYILPLRGFRCMLVFLEFHSYQVPLAFSLSLATKAFQCISEFKYLIDVVAQNNGISISSSLSLIVLKCLASYVMSCIPSRESEGEMVNRRIVQSISPL